MARENFQSNVFIDCASAGVDRKPKNCGLAPGFFTSAPTADSTTVGGLYNVGGVAGAHDRLIWVGKNAADAYQAQILAPELIVTAAAAFTLQNANTAQPCFLAADDTLIVSADTTYLMEAHIMLTTGATSHTTAFGLAVATTTFTSINYQSFATSSAANTLAATQQRRVSTDSAAVLTAASTAVTTNLFLKGIVRINAGGTITPQITFSADPTGTCQTDIDSYFKLVPIGSKTLTELGGWG